MRFRFPLLGEVSAAVTMIGGQVHIQIQTGNDDTAGALTSIQRITGALRWKQVAAPLSLVGPPGAAELDAVRELAATVAVSL